MRSIRLALLSAGLVVVGGARLGQAQTVSPPIEPGSSVTLSSQSLQGVQTRSLSDFKAAISPASLVLQGNPNNLGPLSSPGFRVQDRTMLLIERSRPSDEASSVFLDEAGSDREQRFKVQYQLTDQ
ncbi:MAG: hypothetical protein KME12_09130 [Trichocoleus desertorum ATA4-8-CV12]|jgi:hypothetical protein|nr:hypothetical protein [Trichocoleus desertorum ATA4-8-CV12]